MSTSNYNFRDLSKLSRVVEEEKSEIHDRTRTASANNQSKSTSTINYKEELVLYFCDQMLPYIVAYWENLDPDTISRKNSSELSVAIKEKAASIITRYRKSTKYSNDITPRLATFKSTFNSAFTSYIPVSMNVSKVVVVPSDSDFNDLVFDWFVPAEEEYVHVVFKNGNEYVGTVSNKVMDGKGVFVWGDGAHYEGDFKKGEITGEGILKYAECSYYQGEFCSGMLHGAGTFYPLNTSMVYSGNWRYGKKHGKGWMLYTTGDFYDGEWSNDCREGIGYREYINGTVYNGHWKNGLPDGHGMIRFYNDDFYQGEWSKGNPHGQGEYTWKAGMAKGLTLSIENRYKGTWFNGKRDGYGVLYCGMEGTKLISKFRSNQKHGPGTIICGDGTIIQRNHLFQNDKPMHRSALQRTQSRLSTYSRVHSLRSLHSNKSSNMSMRQSVSKIKFGAKCTPIAIPVHGTASNIHTGEHIWKLTQKYLELMVEPELLGQDPSTWRMSLLSGIHLNIDYNIPVGVNYEFEERKLNNAILLHYKILQDLYTTYASLTYSNKQIKPVLSRLMLWQMHRDLEVCRIGKSLIQIDKMLYQFPGSAIDSEHDPFEPIYFWQFLHSILLISWEYYNSNDFFEKYKECGIFAQMLKHFIKDFIYPNFGNFKGDGLFKYKDLLPMQAVYSLYKSIGEPHTAKIFLKRCCVKKWEEPMCYLGSGFKAEPVKIFCGMNVICTGTNILYLPEDSPDIGEKPMKKCDCPFERDVFYRDLKIFRSLGAKRVVSCLSEVCPLIKQDNLIAYMEYELTFLEFYEVLLLLSLAFIDQVKKEEEKLLKTVDDGNEGTAQVRSVKKENVLKKKGVKGKK